jgi:hypothetical protein
MNLYNLSTATEEISRDLMSEFDTWFDVKVVMEMMSMSEVCPSRYSIAVHTFRELCVLVMIEFVPRCSLDAMIARTLTLWEKKKQQLSWNVRNYLGFGALRKAYNGHAEPLITCPQNAKNAFNSSAMQREGKLSSLKAASNSPPCV